MDHIRAAPCGSIWEGRSPGAGLSLLDPLFRSGSLRAFRRHRSIGHAGGWRNAARAADRRPVAGLWKGGLVALHEGKPRAAGKSPAHRDPLLVSARLIQGEPLTVQSVEVAMRGRTLRWLLGKVDQRRTYFLNGEIQTGRVEPVANIEIYKPVAYSGQIMTLRYARAQELGPWLDLVAAKGEIFVQFWLRPGEQAVAFELGDEPPVDPIPGELRRFL